MHNGEVCEKLLNEDERLLLICYQESGFCPLSHLCVCVCVKRELHTDVLMLG